MMDSILECNPDLVITEKGISGASFRLCGALFVNCPPYRTDYARYFFAKANISALRRVRRSDNNWIARAVGATIVNRVEDLRDQTSERDVGYSTLKRSATSESLFPRHSPPSSRTKRLTTLSFPFPYRYFTSLTECTTPKACTILLRGPSKDILNEIDRNLADAISVARNVVFNPTLVPGGGAVEMAISVGLHARARGVTGVEAGPFRAVADALEVIPRTLVQNAGGNAIRALTALRVRLPSSSVFVLILRQFVFL